MAAFVKGAIGFGYPLIATPLLALATDVRTAVAVLLIPNILMDGAPDGPPARVWSRPSGVTPR